MGVGKFLEQGIEIYSNIADISTAAQLFNAIMCANTGITRAELARLTGFSKSTISQHVETLLATGFVTESVRKTSARKKRSCSLTLNNECGYIIAIDLGVTSLNVGICNIFGEPLLVEDIEDIEVTQEPNKILTIAITCAYRLIHKLNSEKERRILGVGMGIPAPLEFLTGKPVSPPILYAWDGFPVKDYLEEAFGVPAYVDNDVNIMALAENCLGCAQNDRNFLYIKLGTGIGCGIVSNGMIYRGANGCAGDIGHICVNHSDVRCYCGKTGCLERVAGGAAVKEWAISAAQGESPFLSALIKKNKEISARSVYEAILAGDIICIDYVYRIGQYIGDVVAKLVNFYNPSKVIFGGGLSNFGDFLLPSIRETVYRQSNALATSNLHIEYGRLGARAGVIGAAVLVREEMFQPKEFSKIIKNSM